MTKIEKLESLIAEGNELIAGAINQDVGTPARGRFSVGMIITDVRTFVDDDKFQKWKTKVSLFVKEYASKSDILDFSIIFGDTNHSQTKRQMAKLEALYETWKNDETIISHDEFCFIPDNVKKLFQDGHYSQAVFDAYKFIEIEIKRLTQIENIGEKLIREAFNPNIGKLSNNTLPDSEQKSLADLFSGANGFIRNSKAHNNITISKEVAVELLHMANYLLRIVNGQYAERN